MAKMTSKRRKNPGDLTPRNLRATKRRERKLAEDIGRALMSLRLDLETLRKAAILAGCEDFARAVLSTVTPRSRRRMLAAQRRAFQAK